MVPLSRGAFAIVDAADAGLVGDDAWFAHRKHAGLYAARSVHSPGSSPQMETLHRRIGTAMGIPHHLHVDHINGNTLDNRRKNLRGATNSQNVVNSKLRSTNTSGIRGVSLDKKSGKWIAYVRENGRHKIVGRFASRDEAGAVARMERSRVYGEFVPA